MTDALTHKPNSDTLVQHFTLEEGAVLLEPDVRHWFPDLESVNKGLRSLIALMEQMPEKGNAAKSRKKVAVTA